jgi:hypothetical protein
VAEQPGDPGPALPTQQLTLLFDEGTREPSCGADALHGLAIATVGPTDHLGGTAPTVPDQGTTQAPR